MHRSPLTPDDTRSAISALVDLVKAGTRVANAGIGHDPPAGSIAASMYSDSINRQTTWRGSDPVTGVHQEVFYADLAGFDHMRGFVAALGDNRASVSLATIARGGVEAFARAAWLLEPSTAVDAVARLAALELADMKYIVKLTPTGHLRRWTGETVDATQLAQSVRDTVASLKLPEIKAPTPTDLFSDFMTGLPGAEGRVRYSQISSVAHGESFAVKAFLNVREPGDESGPSVEFHLPRNVAIEYTMYLAVACARAQQRIVETFSPPIGEIERWDAAKLRAEAVIRQLTASRADESLA